MPRLAALPSRLAMAVVLVGWAFAARAFPIGPPSPLTVNVKEYLNDFTGHYVLLSDYAEINGVESGAAGPGWRFTGYEFTAYQVSEMRDDAATAQPVCRFYAPAPVNSHFYTADPAECDFLKTHDTGWIFEKVDFKMPVPAQGSCAANRVPIWRAYNNGFAQNNANHRYGNDARVRTKMLAAGWSDEGIAFCAMGADRATQSWYSLAGSGKAPSDACGTQVADGMPCVALRGLPAMNAHMNKWVMPTYSAMSPDYSPAFAAVTGWLPWLEEVYAPAFTANAAADASHSFVQDLGSAPIGIHLNGKDRVSGDYASISPTLPIATRPTTVFQPGGAVFPWAAPHADRDLVIQFEIAVATIRRADDSSHVYGHPLLDFVDATSGHHLWITLQAFGTSAPGDFAGRDVQTGTTIVSTAFRANPLFGTRLSTTDYVQCVANAQGGFCATGTGTGFSFRIDGDDFAKVLQLARAVDPALSANNAQYQLVGFQFHVEAYRDAEAGLEVVGPTVGLSY